jgi:hypothetical protein
MRRVQIGLVAGLLLGCQSFTKDTSPLVKAVVERPVVREGRPVFDEGGMVRMERKTITAREELDRLASFFPGVGEGKHSGIAGGWKAGYWVKFERADGKSVQLTVNHQGTTWSEGQGDWDAPPGLKEHLDRLLVDGDKTPEK